MKEHPFGPDFELIPDRLPHEIVLDRLGWNDLPWLGIAVLAARMTEGVLDSHIAADLKVVDGTPRLLLREVPSTDPLPGWHIEGDESLAMAWPE